MDPSHSAALGALGRSLLDRQFVVVGGKGGVGRTVVSAALARLLSRSGRRVLLAHVRTRQRVETLLGCKTVDHRIRRADDNLWVVNMNPQAALRERGLMILRFKVVYNAVMENRLVRHFLRAVPSLDEYSMLGKAWYHTTETDGDGPRFDTVVFDGPATGHLITMLRIPKVILDVVPEGPLTRDAELIWQMLTDEAKTALWLVTLAEEMPVTEAVDLHRIAQNDLGIRPAALVVNGLYPDDLDRHRQRLAAAHERAHGPLAGWVDAAHTLAQRRAINRRYLDTLARQLPLPRLDLPLLFQRQLDAEAIDRLTDSLADQLQTVLPHQAA